jgi:hypothetical protein
VTADLSGDIRSYPYLGKAMRQNWTTFMVVTLARLQPDGKQLGTETTVSRERKDFHVLSAGGRPSTCSQGLTSDGETEIDRSVNVILFDAGHELLERIASFENGPYLPDQEYIAVSFNKDAAGNKILRECDAALLIGFTDQLLRSTPGSISSSCIHPSSLRVIVTRIRQKQVDDLTMGYPTDSSVH